MRRNDAASVWAREHRRRGRTPTWRISLSMVQLAERELAAGPIDLGDGDVRWRVASARFRDIRALVVVVVLVIAGGVGPIPTWLLLPAPAILFAAFLARTTRVTVRIDGDRLTAVGALGTTVVARERVIGVRLVDAAFTRFPPDCLALAVRGRRRLVRLHATTAFEDSALARAVVLCWLRAGGRPVPDGWLAVPTPERVLPSAQPLPEGGTVIEVILYDRPSILEWAPPIEALGCTVLVTATPRVVHIGVPDGVAVSAVTSVLQRWVASDDLRFRARPPAPR